MTSNSDTEPVFGFKISLILHIVGKCLLLKVELIIYTFGYEKSEYHNVHIAARYMRCEIPMSWKNYFFIHSPFAYHFYI